MSVERLVVGQFMAKRKPDTSGDPFAPGGEVSIEKDFLEADIVRNLTPGLPPAPIGPGKLPNQPPPALSTPAEIPFQPAQVPTPTVPAAQQPSLPVTLSRPPDPGPPSSANPPGYIPDPGPSSSPNPQGHSPLPGPASSANPPDHIPDPGPTSSTNPPSHRPKDPPASTANPPFHQGANPRGAPQGTIIDTSIHVPAELVDLPSDVKIPDSPVRGVPGQPVVDLISERSRVDTGIVKIFSDLDSQGSYAQAVGFPVGGQGTHSLDPSLYAKQLTRIGSMLARGGLFAAQQASLFLLNRRGKIWNPLTAAPIPGTELFVPAMVDVPEKNEIVDHGKIFDSALRESDPKAPITKDKLRRIFDPSNNVIGAVINQVTRLTGGTTGDEFVSRNDPLRKSAFTDGVIPVRFNKDERNGFLRINKGQLEPAIDDDEAYVPMSFTDLRPIGNEHRVVYFRPFITSLNEDFSPEWSMQSYFGRVDPVAAYQSTGRSINLGFQLVSFTPQDVPTIYQKLTWLSSMVYPEYDKDLLYKSGPVVRMRVGNVIDGIGPGGRGLPGIITALSYDYSDAIWELKKNLKVPRNVTVTLSFQVLHDRPIGRGENGRFGGLGDFDSDGGFRLPKGGDAFSAGGDSARSPKVVKGHQSFRAIDDRYDPNDYT